MKINLEKAVKLYKESPKSLSLFINDIDDAEFKFLGIDGRCIPAKFIPYDEDLFDGDRIINTDGVTLIYIKNSDCFVILVNDGSVFLSTKMILQVWQNK